MKEEPLRSSCQFSTVINIITCHPTGLDGRKANIQGSCSTESSFLVLRLFIEKFVRDVLSLELKFQRQAWIMEDI